MLNTNARVVSAACLLVATAAAQAPVSFESPQPRTAVASPDWLSASGSGLQTAQLDSRPSLGMLPTRPLEFAADLQQGGAPQGDNYSLTEVFQGAHGDFLMRRERYDPQIELTSRFFPGAEVQGETGSFDLLQYDLDADLKVPIYPDMYLKFGGYFGGRRYMTSDAFRMRDETLYHTGVHFGVGAFLDDYTLLEVSISPGLWSDLDGGITHKDYDFPGEAVLTMRPMDELFWKVGVRYNQVYEEAPWLPVLGLDWEITEGLRLDITLPEHIEVSYWPVPSTGYMLGFEVTGGQYAVRTSAATGRQRADVQIQEIVAYLGVQHRMNDNLSVYGNIGMSLAGDYDLTTGASGFNRIEGDFGNTVFVELGLGFDF
ncbi:MAG: hypothetical protein KDC48_11260 [Planctomycetes bacterium]|nr:hypothetical protein [Planctomycetota bacterium]